MKGRVLADKIEDYDGSGLVDWIGLDFWTLTSSLTVEGVGIAVPWATAAAFLAAFFFFFFSAAF